MDTEDDNNGVVVLPVRTRKGDITKALQVNRENRKEIEEKRLETLKKKRVMKDVANMLLNVPLRSQYEIDEIKERFPDIPVSEMNLSLSLLIKQVDRALQGDSKAFEVIRDTSGQKPVDEQKIEMETKNVVIDILPEFENE